jgi:phosphate transport system substrate-binding protein
MNARLLAVIILCAATTLTGCPQRQEVTTTTGRISIDCDEALLPLMRLMVEEYQRRYPEALITLVPLEGRSAVVNFVNDSTQMIVLDRPLNVEEETALKSAEVDYRAYNIALDAIAVVVHPGNPVRQMRISRLDSMLSGRIYRWPPRSGQLVPVQLALGGPNSSSNEIVRTKVMTSSQFSPAASYFPSSEEIVDFVKTNEGALGIVPMSWLQTVGDSVSIVRLGDPENPPDSTQLPGTYYGPAQAHIYRDYYPLSTKAYIYNRELLRTVGLGLISFVNNIDGQKIVQKHGLVPATMPVRLVETTSTQVNTQ